MARRSPTNARYQKFQEPPGKTRKSAAAAKPSRKSADPSASKSTSKPSAAAKRSARRMDPQTPEFKALRKRWWILLLSGVVLVTLSWAVRYVDKPGTWLGTKLVTLGQFTLSPAGILASLTLGLAYAAIFYALYLDFAKMRPMRQALSGAHLPKTDKPTDSKTDKAKADKAAKADSAETDGPAE